MFSRFEGRLTKKVEVVEGSGGAEVEFAIKGISVSRLSL